MVTRVAAAAALASGVLLGALGQARADVESVRVRSTGLDLTRPRGAAEMLKRIHHAARALCDDGLPHPLDVGWRARRQACTRDAETRAVAALGVPTMSAALTGRSDAELRLAAR